MPKTLRRKLLPILALSLLTACATTTFDRVQIHSVPVTLHCETLVPYSAQEQDQAANELDKLPADSELSRMMADYGRLRARIRACHAEEKPAK